ncbi:MAG: acyltransferase domain-containing protein [Caldilineaceae bacterium]
MLRHLARLLFTGQGSQYEGMGRELCCHRTVFPDVLDRCEAVAQVHLGRSLLISSIRNDPGRANGEMAQTTALLDDHPALSGQLCAGMRPGSSCGAYSWGVQPDAVLGHSLGDFAAAYAAGVLDLEVGLELVIKRGQLMATVHGAMWAVMASETEMRPFVTDYPDVAIGVINGPQSVVLSGSHVSMTEIAEMVQAAGFKMRKLAIPMAAHSPLLDPVLDEFEAAVPGDVALAPVDRHLQHDRPTGHGRTHRPAPLAATLAQHRPLCRRRRHLACAGH